ncbi:MAG: hypothetical protein BWY09_02906 [Candidatus Hydrogenedentes bacterium ADurb.Bin179]|nr:MAG: hypothetical protein BWY09_02906 [Candidatus Hydrogenedentes bacterium ADurb.Bin179]
MIAAAAGAQLAPSLVLQLAGNRGYRPVLIHNDMGAPVLKICPDSETGLCFDGGPQVLAALILQTFRGQVQNSHFYAAGDIDPHGIGDNGVFRGQHPADRQAVTHMSVRHQRAAHGDGQRAGLFHLKHRLGIQIRTPLLIMGP